MKTVAITKGREVFVSDEDFSVVSGSKWFFRKIGRCEYAARWVRNGATGTRHRQYLHRFLVPGHEQVDHIDGNGLNNVRENLRGVTQHENPMAFKRKRNGASSSFRGVHRLPSGKWSSAIRFCGKTYRLGTFEQEGAAARAYDSAARRYFGEFASPNFKPV